MPYPVKSAISSNIIALLFYVPFNDWYMYAATGALNALCQASSWDDNPYVPPDTISDFTRPNWENIQFMQILTGQIIPYPLNQMEFIDRDPTQGASGLLPCDGGLYSVVSYPNLYALIGNTFGGDSTVFGTPDLRARTPINADNMGTPQGAAGIITASWASATAGQGGEADHTLITAEMPSHSHAISNFLLTGTSVPPPLDAGEEIPHITASTGSTGGGGSHNNIQPSATVFYYIVAY